MWINKVVKLLYVKLDLAKNDAHMNHSWSIVTQINIKAQVPFPFGAVPSLTLKLEMFGKYISVY